MTDSKRSQIMSCIKGKDTKIELALDAALKVAGVSGYERNCGGILGRPDFVWSDCRLIVFLDGCFWHGCPEHFRLPKTNIDFWREKIERNMKRDFDVKTRLVDDGWIVLRIWEHDIKNSIDGCVGKIKRCLGNNIKCTG